VSVALTRSPVDCVPSHLCLSLTSPFSVSLPHLPPISVCFQSTYLDKHLIAQDPFVSVDIPGVGGVIQMAVKRAKHANPQVKVGVCGECGGDPSSVQFFDQIGVDFVACSPHRIPIAKVAAAQAHIKQRSGDRLHCRRLKC